MYTVNAIDNDTSAWRERSLCFGCRHDQNPMQRQGPLRFQRSSVRINKPATFIVKERKKFDSISIKNSRVAFPLRFWCQAME
jgi:hypothetical protein